jgi:hypothetical protein
MTQDEIMEMAQKCRLIGSDPRLYGIYMDALLSFAKLVAEAEREACAKVADAYADGLERNYSEIIADAIRARGQA